MNRAVIIALALVAGVCHGDEPAAPQLSVLYCGNPGSERENDFVSFLTSSGFAVSTTDTRTFQPAEARGHDVVVIDWTNWYDGNGSLVETNMLKPKHRGLPDDFDRPCILIGGAGAITVQLMRLKIDWLCLCLDGPAWKPRLDHEVFHKPLEVDPQLEVIATPWDARYSTLDGSLGRTMTVWHVQTKNFPDIDPGLVSDLYGFEDSPDAEVITQGVSGKGPDALALGRQGNYFLWGFSAPPSEMTPSGRRLFTNVVTYISKFDGQRPMVTKEARSRLWALRAAMAPQYLSQEYLDAAAASYRARFEQDPERIPEEKRGDIDGYLDEVMDRMREFQELTKERLLPKELIDRYGNDASAYRQYYEQNLEYLRPEGMMFVVDEDVKQLGVSNRDATLLETCIRLLENEQNVELARRVLERYTSESFGTATAWRQWLEENREKLFFSDVGGFRFFVAPEHTAEDVGSIRPAGTSVNQ